MEKKHKKYSVDYCSGATGYGWTQEFDRLDEFEDFINELRHESTAAVWVYDYQLGCFIFIKRTLTFEPEVDMLRSAVRDMRTTTRTVKIGGAHEKALLGQ